MERYSLMLITDETRPIRRFDVRRKFVHRLAGAAAGISIVALGAMVDWVGLRIERPELLALRGEAERNRAKIASVEAELLVVSRQLEQVREFERKIRIIANLPGAAGTGGEEVTPESDEAGPAPEFGVGGALEAGESASSAERSSPGAGLLPAGASADLLERTRALRELAQTLFASADERKDSLVSLLDELETKQHELASSPAIWPARGWLTSGFGHRISPFTGGRQFHSGIDIAGRAGIDIVAPARGMVTSVGKCGYLGNCVKLEHGFGITTLYGHLQGASVSKGEAVERGQVIASMGNTGRSTGPHLHYTVEIHGKPVNPLDYIFD
jgi:murein DD-endopeptidase MepM/ murein hydrolase activator NlpD